MRFRATIEVGLRKDHFDPESETIKKTLRDLNFQVNSLRVLKVYQIVLDSGSKKEAETTVRKMCSRLLVNPTKDDFHFKVEPIDNGSES
ncbi:MAG: phosphoribosylformylglycinamidine synthase subunit PurS [Thaumarchaeota archaeon]|nr:phosphoribosylformylglycinamidine synthase subunit PurS [Nitrososphaerota archaeon]